MEDKDLLAATKRARELKQILERDIAELLVRFTGVTGLRVNAVHLDDILLYGYGCNPEYLLRTEVGLHP